MLTYIPFQRTYLAVAGLPIIETAHHTHNYLPCHIHQLMASVWLHLERAGLTLWSIHALEYSTVFTPWMLTWDSSS